MLAELNEEITVLIHVLAIMLIAILTVWLVCHTHDRREEKKQLKKRSIDVLNVDSKGDR